MQVRPLINLLFLVILSLFSSCISYKSVEFVKVEKVNLNLSSVPSKSGFEILIRNPNSSGLRLRGAEANFQLLEKSLGNASLAQSIYIPANSESSIPFILNFDTENLNDMIPSGLDILFGNSSRELRVRGFIRLRKHLWYKKLDFDLKQKIDLDLLKSLKL